MIVHNVGSLEQFRQGHYNAVPLGGGKNSKVMLVCLESGQFIPVHDPGIDLCLLIIAGEGILADEAGQRIGKAGDLLYVVAGEKRGLRATSRLVALAMVAPPPGPDDHVQVERLLRKGRWCDDG